MPLGCGNTAQRNPTFVPRSRDTSADRLGSPNRAGLRADSKAQETDSPGKDLLSVGVDFDRDYWGVSGQENLLRGASHYQLADRSSSAHSDNDETSSGGVSGCDYLLRGIFPPNELPNLRLDARFANFPLDCLQFFFCGQERVRVRFAIRNV